MLLVAICSPSGAQNDHPENAPAMSEAIALARAAGDRHK